MDMLNHLLGTCGELHPNLFTVSLFLGLLIYLKNQIKFSKQK